MGVISERSASPCAQHEILVPEISCAFQHSHDPVINHILIFLFTHPLLPLSYHWHDTGKYGNNHRLIQKISVFITNNLHLRRKYHCIRPHTAMKAPVILIILGRAPAFQRQKKRTLPTQLLFPRPRPMPDPAARIHLQGLLQHLYIISVHQARLLLLLLLHQRHSSFLITIVLITYFTNQLIYYNILAVSFPVTAKKQSQNANKMCKILTSFRGDI